MDFISLEKRTEEVGIRLEKHGLRKAPVVRVGAAFDVSGSAQWMYQNGTMQSVYDRLFAIAIKLDDNGEIDTWLFDTSTYKLPTAKKEDYGTFITKQIAKARGIWNGTNYAPCFKAMEDFFYEDAVTTTKGGIFGFGKKTTVTAADTSPSLAFFITDGECFDTSQAEAVLKESQDKPMYWHMVGVGNADFSFLKKMGNKYPNVGFINMSSLAVSDDELYDNIVTDEFCNWLKTQ